MDFTNEYSFVKTLCDASHSELSNASECWKLLSTEFQTFRMLKFPLYAVPVLFYALVSNDQAVNETKNWLPHHLNNTRLFLINSIIAWTKANKKLPSTIMNALKEVVLKQLLLPTENKRLASLQKQLVNAINQCEIVDPQNPTPLVKK